VVVRQRPRVRVRVVDSVHHFTSPNRRPRLTSTWTGHGGVPTSIGRVEREGLERENKLRVWSYRRELRQWLQTSRDACQAPKVRWFMDDLLNYLSQTFAGKRAAEEDEV
jgi:hypothetical protein